MTFPALDSWHRACRLFLPFVLIALTWPALGQVTKPFIVGTDTEPEAYFNRLSALIYEEAFKRLGMSWKYMNYPLARRTALVEQGAIDAEAARTLAYGSSHPELIRVEEPILDFTFSIYTANATLRARKLEDLPVSVMADYRRGIVICENALKKAIPAERLADVTTTEQGIKKLLAGRSDIYCEIDGYIGESLRSDAMKGVSGGENIRKLFDIATVPTYPYLAHKHADLAPRLAAVLKQMKAEGLYAGYYKQLERQAPGRR